MNCPFKSYNVFAFVLQEGTSKFANLDNRLNNKHFNRVSTVEIKTYVKQGSVACGGPLGLTFSLGTLNSLYYLQKTKYSFSLRVNGWNCANMSPESLSWHAQFNTCELFSLECQIIRGLRHFRWVSLTEEELKNDLNICRRGKNLRSSSA